MPIELLIKDSFAIHISLPFSPLLNSLKYMEIKNSYQLYFSDLLPLLWQISLSMSTFLHRNILMWSYQFWMGCYESFITLRGMEILDPEVPNHSKARNCSIVFDTLLIKAIQAWLHDSVHSYITSISIWQILSG